MMVYGTARLAQLGIRATGRDMDDIIWTYDRAEDRYTCTIEHCELMVCQDVIERWVGTVRSGRRTIRAINFPSLRDAQVWCLIVTRRLNTNDRRQQER